MEVAEEVREVFWVSALLQAMSWHITNQPVTCCHIVLLHLNAVMEAQEVSCLRSYATPMAPSSWSWYSDP